MFFCAARLRPVTTCALLTVVSACVPGVPSPSSPESPRPDPGAPPDIDLCDLEDERPDIKALLDAYRAAFGDEPCDGDGPEPDDDLEDCDIVPLPGGALEVRCPGQPPFVIPGDDDDGAEEPEPEPEGEPEPDPAPPSCFALPYDGQIIDCYALLSAAQYCDSVYSEPSSPNYSLVGACGQCNAVFYSPPEGVDCFAELDCINTPDLCGGEVEPEPEPGDAPALYTAIQTLPAATIPLDSVEMAGPLGDRTPEGAVVTGAYGGLVLGELGFALGQNDTLGYAQLLVLIAHPPPADPLAPFNIVHVDAAPNDALWLAVDAFLAAHPGPALAPTAATALSRAAIWDQGFVEVPFEHLVIHVAPLVADDYASVTYELAYVAWSSAWPGQPQHGKLRMTVALD